MRTTGVRFLWWESVKMGRRTGTLAAALAITTILVANTCAAAVSGPIPSASSLARFYPTELASTPVGFLERPDVWLAKVQGLLAGAPALFQQSLLASKTAEDFAANVALLEQMQQGTFKQALLDIQSQAKSGRPWAKALGDAGNLAYKALRPCRIMDTRNATAGSGVQGPINGGSLRQLPGFVTAGLDWSQYGQTGTPSDCGLTNPPGAAIKAIAIVITILDPNFDAFLGVSDANSLATTLSTVALNYTRAQGLSTMYIVPQIANNNIYFALPAGLSAQLIFDVVGYFSLFDATALECTTKSESAAVIGANSGGNTSSGLCDTGYALTGGSCDSDSLSMILVSNEPSNLNREWFCAASNTGGSPANLRATANCCRIPGK